MNDTIEYFIRKGKIVSKPEKSKDSRYTDNQVQNWEIEYKGMRLQLLPEYYKLQGQTFKLGCKIYFFMVPTIYLSPEGKVDQPFTAIGTSRYKLELLEDKSNHPCGTKLFSINNISNKDKDSVFQTGGSKKVHNYILNDLGELVLFESEISDQNNFLCLSRLIADDTKSPVYTECPLNKLWKLPCWKFKKLHEESEWF